MTGGGGVTGGTGRVQSVPKGSSSEICPKILPIVFNNGNEPWQHRLLKSSRSIDLKKFWLFKLIREQIAMQIIIDFI